MNRILSIAAVMLLASDSTSLAGTYLYVSVAGENKISVFGVDPETGGLTHQADVATPGKPGSLAVDPSRKFLFAAVRSTGAGQFQNRFRDRQTHAPEYVRSRSRSLVRENGCDREVLIVGLLRRWQSRRACDRRRRRNRRRSNSVDRN